MKLPVDIIILGLSLSLVSGKVYAQVPWGFDTTSNKHEIIIKPGSKLTVEGQPLKSGDAIGVFYISGDEGYRNAGYMIVEDTSGQQLLTAYGNDVLEESDGFKEGEPFHFMVWLRDSGCIIENVEVEWAGNSQEKTFISKGKSELLSLSGEKGNVYYPRSIYCEGEQLQLITPFMENVAFPVRFSVVEGAGLYVDSETGTLDLSETPPGTYKIYFDTNQCLKSSIFNLEVLDSDSLPKKELPEKSIYLCDTETKVTLHASSGNASYLWSTGEVTDSIQVSQPGEYTVEITNETGCKVVDVVQVLVSKSISRDEVTIETQGASCEQGGSIKLLGGFWAHESIEFKLYHHLLGKEYVAENYQFNDIDEGVYDLLATNESNCETVLYKDIIIEKSDGCKYPVLSPDGDGTGDDYFVTDVGHVEIYDRYGQLVNKMVTPTSWDGTDYQGHPLPMGTYMLLINNRYQKFITLIR